MYDRKLGDSCHSVEDGMKSLGGDGRARQMSHYCRSERNLDGV